MEINQFGNCGLQFVINYNRMSMKLALVCGMEEDELLRIKPRSGQPVTQSNCLLQLSLFIRTFNVFLFATFNDGLSMDLADHGPT